MSIQYEKSDFVEFKNGISQNKVQCQVSSVSELKMLTNITDGSIAYNKRTGEVYSFDDGIWYNSDGSGAV